MLEVPTEAEALNENLPNTGSSSIESTVFTLDPHQKYRPLRPLGCKLALTKSDVTSPKSPSGQISTQMLSPSEMQRPDPVNKPFRHFGKVPSDLSELKDGGRPTSSGLLPRESTMMNIFHRIRGTRSAEYSRGEHELHSPQDSGGVPSELIPSKPVSLEVAMESAYAKSSIPASHVSLTTPTTLLARPQAPKTRYAESIGAKLGTESHHAQECRVPVIPEVPQDAPLRYDYQITPLGTSFEQQGLQCAGQSPSPKVPVAFGEAQSASNSQSLDLLSDRFCQLLDGESSRPSTSSNALAGKPSSMDGNVKQCSSTDHLNDAFSTSLGYSLTSNGSSSTFDLSELDLLPSPCIEHRYKLFDYGRKHDDSTITDEEHARPSRYGPKEAAGNLPIASARGKLLTSGCFSEHSLPPLEQASALTAKLSQRTSYPSQYSASTLLSPSPRTDRILVWSGKSKHHLTATEELADELGYLGEVII